MTANTERVVTQTQLARLAEWSMRKPVIALMGEFSSGKSTLMNLLIGQNILPTQVTATRMPPVWLTYGDAPPYRMDHDGQKHPVSLNNADTIPIRTTSYIRLYVKADILKSCDLIDTPGISDPNIKTNYWIRTIRYANAVMWCTQAGQAWRESERGAWEALPTRLRETSILLVTRKDKITSDRDLRKIQRRLERETQTLFNSRMFVSLTNAIKARKKGDANAWTESGAEDFAEMLEKIVEGIYVQRSFMLARYVTNDGANAKPETESAPDLENGNMLGFVGKAEAESQSDQLVSQQSHSETSISERADGNAQNDRLGIEATAEAVARADDLNAQPEPKSPRGDLKLDAYRLNDPSTYRGEEGSRVQLSNYQLKNPAQTDDLTETTDVSENPECNTTEPDIGTELELTKKIWNEIQTQHDISHVHRLATTFEQLIANLQREYDVHDQQKKSA